MKKFLFPVIILVCAWFLGSGAAFFFSRSPKETRQIESAVSSDSVSDMSVYHTDSDTSMSSAEKYSWGLSYQQDGQPPVGNQTPAELAKYDAFYVQETEKKVIYLTFDEGYENGNTSSILDTLKKHNVSATFFVVGPYIESEPDLIRRMADEGHIVGNHTWNHPDMSGITSKEAFEKELKDVEDAFFKATGKKMTRFYRPPQGKYSESNLQTASNLGYKTIFWSLAYVDWMADKQPTKEEAFDKLLNRIHPGAIVLLHAASDTNTMILDELLDRWDEMGYQVRPLTEIQAAP